MSRKNREYRVPIIPPGPLDAAFSVVDLFAGAGGLSEGFRHAGYRITGGSDIDPDATATFALNFPEAAVVTGDLRAPAVREQIADIARRADVIVGGPPCQAFSQMRNHCRLIDDPRNSLYREFIRTVREAGPAAFVMENVTGIDQMGAREQMLADLEMDGEYRVRPQVADAADFGVPQTRKRLLFIGVHRRMGCAAPLLAGTGATTAVFLARRTEARVRYKVVVEEQLLAANVPARLADPDDDSVVGAKQAISDLAGLPPGNREDTIACTELPEPASAYQRAMRAGHDGSLANVQVPRINDDTRLRLQAIPPGGNYRDLGEALLGRHLTGQRWGQENGTGRLSRRHFYAYRRLHPDIWAWTLNTKADAAYHYSAHRALSVREFARLQSFPDSFVFTTDPRAGMIPGRIDGGPAHSRYRQAGNAVPPRLARASAEALWSILAAGIAPGAARRKTA